MHSLHISTRARAMRIGIVALALQAVYGFRKVLLSGRESGEQTINITMAHPTFNQNGHAVKSVRMRSKHLGHYPGGEYDMFKNAAGVSNSMLEDLHFAKVFDPPKHDVQFITIVAAGLQDGSGSQQSITGQHNNFKSGYSATSTDTWMSLDSRSFANQVAASNKVFPSTKTLFIDIFDAAFKPAILTSESQRVALMVAWKKYLDGKVIWANIKGMMFAAMSRGGCFVFRFSDYLLNHEPSLHPNVPVIMELTDSVCDQGEGYTEGGTNNGLVNPKRPSGKLWKGWKTDFSKETGWGHVIGKHRSELCMFTQGSGEDAFAGFGRYFVPSDASDTQRDDQTWSVAAHDYMGGGNWTWLRFFWAADEHENHGRNFLVRGGGQTPFGVPSRDSAWNSNSAGDFYLQHEATTKHAYMCAERYSRVYSDWSACEPDPTKPCGKGLQRRTCSRDPDWDPWYLHGACADIIRDCDLDHNQHPEGFCYWALTQPCTSCKGYAQPTASAAETCIRATETLPPSTSMQSSNTCSYVGGKRFMRCNEPPLCKWGRWGGCNCFTNTQSRICDRTFLSAEPVDPVIPIGKLVAWEEKEGRDPVFPTSAPPANENCDDASTSFVNPFFIQTVSCSCVIATKAPSTRG